MNIKTKGMKTFKNLLVLAVLFISTLSYSQYRRYDDSVTFSVYSAFKFSKGFEIRGEFGDWYMAFQAENFYKDVEGEKDMFHFNWGGAIGILRSHRDFNFLGGIRLGLMHIPDDTSKPSYGVEAEVDYNLNENVFIGIRGTYDQYLNSTPTEPNSVNYSRVFAKIGVRF